MPEMNASGGRIDLAISKISLGQNNNAVKEKLLLIELKYEKDAGKVNDRMDEAKGQIYDYVNSHNFKSLTDQKRIITISIVFDKEKALKNVDPKKTEGILLFHLSIADVSHTSTHNTPEISSASSGISSTGNTPEKKIGTSKRYLESADQNNNLNKKTEIQQSQNNHHSIYRLNKRSTFLIIENYLYSITILANALESNTNLLYILKVILYIYTYYL